MYVVPITPFLHLLVVDDEPENQLVTTLLLQRAFPSARLTVCDSALQAIKTIREEHIDLVITDNSMRDLSGLDLIRAIRKTDATVPIIFHTGSYELEAQAREAGANLFLPATEVTRLTHAVNSLILQKSIGTQPAASKSNDAAHK